MAQPPKTSAAAPVGQLLVEDYDAVPAVEAEITTDLADDFTDDDEIEDDDDPFDTLGYVDDLSLGDWTGEDG